MITTRKWFRLNIIRWRWLNKFPLLCIYLHRKRRMGNRFSTNFPTENCFWKKLLPTYVEATFKVKFKDVNYICSKRIESTILGKFDPKEARYDRSNEYFNLAIFSNWYTFVFFTNQNQCVAKSNTIQSED